MPRPVPPPAAIPGRRPSAEGAARAAPGVVRRLWPADRDAFRDHLLRLDPACRRLRFGATASDAVIEAYAARCFAGGAPVGGAPHLVGWFVDGVLRGASEVHLGSWAAGRGAEIALSVEAPHRSRGVGARLFERALVAARNRGATRLTVRCLPWNEPMKALARRFSAVIRFEPDEATGLMVAAPGTPWTLAQEAATDWAGALAATLEAQARWLRPRGGPGAALPGGAPTSTG